jgi:hypothetical protein
LLEELVAAGLFVDVFVPDVLGEVVAGSVEAVAVLGVLEVVVAGSDVEVAAPGVLELVVEPVVTLVVEAVVEVVAGTVVGEFGAGLVDGLVDAVAGVAVLAPLVLTVVDAELLVAALATARLEDEEPVAEPPPPPPPPPPQADNKWVVMNDPSPRSTVRRRGFASECTCNCKISWRFISSSSRQNGAHCASADHT